MPKFTREDWKISKELKEVCEDNRYHMYLIKRDNPDLSKSDLDDYMEFKMAEGWTKQARLMKKMWKRGYSMATLQWYTGMGEKRVMRFLEMNW